MTDWKEDLRDLKNDIVTEMRSGFKGVHDRQDSTNGRIGKAEVALGELRVRTVNLEREVFPRHRGEPLTPAPMVSEPPQSRDRRVTERDVRMVLAGAGGAAALLVFLWKVLPFLHNAL